MAVIANTDLKSKKMDAIGTNNNEDPKPETVPITSEINARSIKR